MRFWHLVLVLPLLLNCPKQIVPRIAKIEVDYLSSLYEDLYKEKPLLARAGQLEGIKIGHLITDPPFMEKILGRLGFYQLLDEFALDFIIVDSPVYGMNFFPIQKSMGYGINNYKNIRFAIVSKDKDSLTIDDEIKMSLIRQRSDVMWVLDKTVLDLGPTKIDFLIKNREFSDTSMVPIDGALDTVLLNKLYQFRQLVDEYLNKRVYLENKTLDEYILSTIALREDVNVILYPEGLFCYGIEDDSISIRDILIDVSCELKLKRAVMTKTKLLDYNEEKGYRTWGQIIENNSVMLPVVDAVSVEDTVSVVDAAIGDYVFDLFYEGDKDAD